LLGEALGGSGAGVRDGAGKLRNGHNPDISVGLTDITLKCLSTKPAERYRDAASLADDLRRHLNDLPLRGVANRSLSERWRKWRRGQPAPWAEALPGRHTGRAGHGRLPDLYRPRQLARNLQVALQDAESSRQTAVSGPPIFFVVA
jgi:hypothetical protein